MKKIAAVLTVLAGSIAVLAGSAMPALAGPTYTFTTSTGTQPSNVGTITLTQSGANAVIVNVDLLTPTASANYGFVNTGGPHVTFGFDLNVSGGLSISTFTTPPGGVAPNGTFTLDTGGAGGFNTVLDYSGGNGSSNGYFGDLVFTLSRTSGLSTDNFISNGTAYFAADLTNNPSNGNTGEQFWNNRSTTNVPEPMTLSLFGAGLAGAVVLRRRRKKAV